MTTHESPATVGQRLLWLMEYYRGNGDGSFNEALIWRLRGPLQGAALARALTALFEQQEALRTTLSNRGRKLVQVVNDPRPAELTVEDLRAESDPESQMQQRLLSEVSARIDITEWPVRVRLWRVAESEHVLCLTMHHLVTDYRSLEIIAQFLAARYAHETAGRPSPAAPAWQYRDWVSWQADLLSGASRRALERYWSGQLAAVRPFPLPRAGDDDAATTVDMCEFEDERARCLHALVARESTSLLAVTLSLFYALVFDATGVDDITVASTFTNRQPAEVAGTVGFFENMVLLRGQVRPDEPFTDLVRRVHAVIEDAERHQGLPYHMLPPSVTRGGPDATGIRPDTVVFNTVGLWPAAIDLGDVTAENVVPRREHRGARFGLRVVVMDNDERVIVMAVYDDQVTGWVRRLTRDYDRLADRVLADPTISVRALGDTWRAGAAP